MQMSETGCHDEGRQTYYVYGSGLVAVPYHRMNDVPEMKLEFHARESRNALLLAWARKLV
jgi:hypothetical protein